jgi:hypothetical protein
MKRFEMARAAPPVAAPLNSHGHRFLKSPADTIAEIDLTAP